MKHYWNEVLDDDFKPQIFTFDFLGENYSLYSSEGVFSKNKADEGSLILTEVLIDEINKIKEEKGLNLYKALDIGCGNALISILLANKISDFNADLIDISERAIKLSELNINLYNYSSKLNVFESDKFEKINEEYDFIFTNPPIRTGKENVHAILEDSIKHLKKGGVFFAVIRKKHGAPSAIKKLEEVYGNSKILKRSKGYYVISSQKI